jgi:lipopolysaccharide heptosyltransferase II
MMFDLPIRPEARVSVQRLLAENGLSTGQPYLVVGPGTRWETKQWPAEHFATAITQIANETGLGVVLTGMAEEREIAERVAAATSARTVNMAGKTSLPEMIALIADARAILMHDSGPMHLASAMGKPMVAIYGPTNPARTGPYGRAETVARLNLPCSPCYLKKVADCPYGHRCMIELRPEVVATLVLKAVEQDKIEQDK